MILVQLRKRIWICFETFSCTSCLPSSAKVFGVGQFLETNSIPPSKLSYSHFLISFTLMLHNSFKLISITENLHQIWKTNSNRPKLNMNEGSMTKVFSFLKIFPYYTARRVRLWLADHVPVLFASQYFMFATLILRWTSSAEYVHLTLKVVMPYFEICRYCI